MGKHKDTHKVVHDHANHHVHNVHEVVKGYGKLPDKAAFNVQTKIKGYGALPIKTAHDIAKIVGTPK